MTSQLIMNDSAMRDIKQKGPAGKSLTPPRDQSLTSPREKGLRSAEVDHDKMTTRTGCKREPC